MHCLFPCGRRRLAVQQMQEMRADRIVVGLDLDAPAVMAEVIPVQQHRAERGHQLVGDVARARNVVVVLFRQGAAERRYAGTHHVHRVRSGGQAFQHRLHVRRQAAQHLQLGLVALQFAAVGQLAVHQQIGDFLEFAGIGHIQDVVAAVMQIVAGAAHRAKRSVARGNTRQGDGFLWFWSGSVLLAHIFSKGDIDYLVFCWAKSASSFCSKS